MFFSSFGKVFEELKVILTFSNSAEGDNLEPSTGVVHLNILGQDATTLISFIASRIYREFNVD